MALGAEPADLVRLVLTQGLAVTALGLIVGTAAALQFTRLLGYLLYKVSPRDQVTFLSAVLIVAAASIAACVVPGVRASRTEPIRALRG